MSRYNVFKDEFDESEFLGRFTPDALDEGSAERGLLEFLARQGFEVPADAHVCMIGGGDDAPHTVELFADCGPCLFFAEIAEEEG